MTLLPTAPLTIFLHPENNPKGLDLSNAWQILMTELNRLEQLIAQTNTVVNGLQPNVLFYVGGAVPGNTIANTAAETTFASTCLFKANTLPPGQVIKVDSYFRNGYLTGAQTWTFRMYLQGVLIFTTGTQTITGPLTAGGYFTANAQVKAAAIECQGFAAFDGGGGTQVIVESGVLVSPTIDFTKDALLTFTWQWGTTDPANSAGQRLANVFLY